MSVFCYGITIAHRGLLVLEEVTEKEGVMRCYQRSGLIKFKVCSCYLLYHDCDFVAYC